METKSLKIFDSGERSILNKRIVPWDKYSQKALDVVTYSAFKYRKTILQNRVVFLFQLSAVLQYSHYVYRSYNRAGD